MLRFIALCLLAVISSACTKTTSIRHALDYENKIARSDQAIVLPPKVDVNMVDFSGKQTQMYNYEVYIADLISERIVVGLNKKGLRAVVLHKRDIKEKGLYKDLVHARSNYDKARDNLYTPLLWEEEKSFNIEKNIGEHSGPLGEKTQSDLLVFVDYAQNVKTNGARVAGFVTDMFLGSMRRNSFSTAEDLSNDTDTSVMFVGIVGAQSGDLLWSNFFKISHDLFSSMWQNAGDSRKTDIKHLDKIIDGALHELKKL
jgi:hypothetical protein